MRMAVVCDADLGRSPRVQYHAQAFADAGADVDLVGAVTTPLPEPPALSGVRVHALDVLPLALPRGRLRLASLAVVAARGGLSALRLLGALLFTLRRPRIVLLAIPPSLPSLAMALLAARLRRAELVVDWHNFSDSMLALKLGPGHRLVALVRRYDRVLARRASAHLCVSESMASELRGAFGLADVTVLVDEPHGSFRPLPPESRSGVLAALAEGHALAAEPLWRRLVDGGAERPALVVAPSSFSLDDDFDLLFDALGLFEARMRDEESSGAGRCPELLVLLTGRGPRRDEVERKVAARAFHRVHARTLWLPAPQYASLLAAADLGVCVHRSSSGADFPMKLADMSGAGLPACVLDYGPCLRERLAASRAHLLFTDADDLAGRLAAVFRDFPGPSARLHDLREAARTTAGVRWEDAWSAAVLPLVHRLTAAEARRVPVRAAS
jgi:beta-1,4-mannosyltransferase